MHMKRREKMEEETEGWDADECGGERWSEWAGGDGGKTQIPNTIDSNTVCVPWVMPINTTE